MKKIALIVSTLLVSNISFAQNATQGQKVFQTSCAACHSVGKGKLVGPDLAGVNSRRNEKWLLSWIKSSQAMVKKNDPVGVKLFNEYNKIAMPDQNLSDAQIKDVLAYIKSGSPATKPTAKPAGGGKTTNAR